MWTRQDLGYLKGALIIVARSHSTTVQERDNSRFAGGPIGSKEYQRAASCKLYFDFIFFLVFLAAASRDSPFSHKNKDVYYVASLDLQ